MLNIFLQEYDDSNLEKLTGLCGDCFELDWDARILPGAKTPSELLNRIKSDLPALFIFEDARQDELDKAVADIRLKNMLHYLILRLWAVEDAMKVRPAYYRVSGFLLHPVEKRQLKALLESVYSDFSSKNTYGGYFSPKIRGVVYQLPFSRILYFESRGKKIIARTASQEYDFYDSLEQVSGSTPDFFLRVHRGFCVNLRQIDSVNISEKLIYMKDGSNVPFSRTFKQSLLDAFEGGF